jgi:hypothetical protein
LLQGAGAVHDHAVAPDFREDDARRDGLPGPHGPGCLAFDTDERDAAAGGAFGHHAERPDVGRRFPGRPEKPANGRGIDGSSPDFGLIGGQDPHRLGRGPAGREGKYPIRNAGDQ